MAASLRNTQLIWPLAGVKRINVSLDTLDEEKFARITRWGRLPQVLRGIDAAQKAGHAGEDQHRGAEGL